MQQEESQTLVRDIQKQESQTLDRDIQKKDSQTLDRDIQKQETQTLDRDKFHCFTVHFNSLNLTYQIMHFYMLKNISLKY
jgi:hypothetical protein